MIAQNLNVVQQFTGSDVSTVINFILDKPEQVKTQIDEMKKPTKKGKDETPPASKWGKYEDVSSLLKELIPAPDFLKMIQNIFSTLLGSENLSDYVEDTSKEFSTEIVKQLLGCSDGDTRSECSQKMTLENLLIKLLGGDSTAEASVQKD